jgi:uncharacterized integral membrane protein
MMKDSEQSARPIGKMVLFGLLSLALYVFLFSNADWVMRNFTRGGAYAALPIATVFVFSFVHGAFASYLWSVLGIGVTRRPVVPKARETRRVVRRPRPRPRLRVEA